MNLLHQDLAKSLQTGFINQLIQSNTEYLPQLLVNDKRSGKKVLSTIDRELKKCDEFWFSVAFVTTSGVATLANTFDEIESRGIKGKILVSQYLNFTQPEALKKLLQFKNIELKIAVNGDFHSKGYLFKNGEIFDIIIGSSNLTANALCLNKELNLKISATPASYIINNTIKEFSIEFNNAIPVTNDFIKAYEPIYKNQFTYNKELNKSIDFRGLKEISPNEMQREALANICQLRSLGKNKALLISATGTGKTYLSAFDARKFEPKRLLFLVHRLNIAEAAMKTFKRVFGNEKTMGLYSGEYKDIKKDFIFSTVQTISREDHLSQLDPNLFDYIVIDETHRAGAESYQRIMRHFTPKFLLGMTATPERTDGLDIFKLFDHTIAYEIRLHKALEEEMLSPFHYYGVTDITVDGKILEENADFSLLTSNERIERIIEKAKFYGTDSGITRGLVFCSNIDECKTLCVGFNQKGYKSIALTGSNSENERVHAISRLESDDLSEKIDYIFTVDIFNEGVDIPRVNQIIMLRPTQSAIIFVQQLGRGLRKIDEKEYLTVIDFIGNYSNNYLVPIALYGDTSYNKDALRKLMSTGSNLIPGTSTINFDRISQAKIYEAIDSANMQLKKDLVTDYNLLKFKIGHTPMMMDFVDHSSRDPQLYVFYSKSYFNFVNTVEKELSEKLDPKEIRFLELFSNEINNSKRVEESIILKELLRNGIVDIEYIKKIIKNDFQYDIAESTIKSCIRNLNFEFVTQKQNQKLVSVQSIINFLVVEVQGTSIRFTSLFSTLLQNAYFKKYLLDSTLYSIVTYTRHFVRDKFVDGFILYQKYSRKDAFRILNWDSNPLAQNVGGYLISPNKKNCPIFVNYHKEENISNTTKYLDHFINQVEFGWMTKSNRTLKSTDVQAIKNSASGLRLPLFIKKSNDEGTEFYYMGDVIPFNNGFEQTKMMGDKNKEVSVVKVRFQMSHVVEENMFDYITKRVG